MAVSTLTCITQSSPQANLTPLLLYLFVLRLHRCAGVCHYSTHGGCRIRLSEPLLKFRPVRDLKDVLLHEMIHAYLMLQGVRDDEPSGHGTHFKTKMTNINTATFADHQRPPGGYRITVYHTMHDEVNNYRTHAWECSKCGSTIKRSMNRPPQEADCRGYSKKAAAEASAAGKPGSYCEDRRCGYHSHLRHCGGKYIKIAEPDKLQPAGNSKRSQAGSSKAGAEAGPSNSKRPKPTPAAAVAGMPLIDSFFKQPHGKDRQQEQQQKPQGGLLQQSKEQQQKDKQQQQQPGRLPAHQQQPEQDQQQQRAQQAQYPEQQQQQGQHQPAAQQFHKLKKRLPPLSGQGLRKGSDQPKPDGHGTHRSPEHQHQQHNDQQQEPHNQYWQGLGSGRVLGGPDENDSSSVLTPLQPHWQWPQQQEGQQQSLLWQPQKATKPSLLERLGLLSGQMTQQRQQLQQPSQHQPSTGLSSSQRRILVWPEQNQQQPQRQQQQQEAMVGVKQQPSLSPLQHYQQQQPETTCKLLQRLGLSQPQQWQQQQLPPHQQQHMTAPAVTQGVELSWQKQHRQRWLLWKQQQQQEIQQQRQPLAQVQHPRIAPSQGKQPQWRQQQEGGVHQIGHQEHEHPVDHHQQQQQQVGNF
eukprot:GHRR01011950.1.p1 GENE.GHRR01011950.1~~GHRR01011950.1.p1  ORF type:complete len:634 (+),score=298.82 GHRR01011950.1:873-2774(+)